MLDLIWRVASPIELQVGQWVGSGGLSLMDSVIQMQIGPGLGGLGEEWAGMTSSSPDWSESLSDSEIGRSFIDAWCFFASCAGNRVSLNFTSQEISMHWWAASQNWYPLEPGS